MIGSACVSSPPNVEPLEPTPSDKAKATIRQQLESHTTHSTCASCHAKIDPLGFAFENYDAIGRWRTRELVTTGLGDNPKIDASGTLPDGRPFRDSKQFKQLGLEGDDKVKVGQGRHKCSIHSVLN